ncbi:MAG: GAF domain-containing protein [Anaerolineales bacterium]|nr:GAF domain-containing protein [Anaerolineales bacterium]
MSASPFSSSPYRILIVEDDPSLRGGIAEILREASMEVVEVTNIQDALAQVKISRPQLILLSDTLFQAQSGELGILLKSEALPRRPLIILLGTAGTTSDTQSGGMEHGADSYILRSIPMREFVARVQSLANLQSLEEKSNYLNRVLRAIRNVNQLIVREKDRQALLQKSCEILIESGGYFNAWIVTFSPDGQIETIVEAGLGEAFTEMRQRLSKGELTAVERQAMTQKEVVIVEDPSIFCTDCPLAAGYAGRAGMSVSLRYGDRAYGVLTVSLPKEFINDAEEKSLLHEVAGDLAFALHNIELEESQSQIAAALRQSRRQLATLINNLPGIAYRCQNDPEWTMEYLSAGCLDLTGYDAEELIGNKNRSYASLIHPEDRNAVWENVQKAVSENRPYQLTYRIIAADGSEKWVWEKGEGVFDDGGNLVALEGFITDISERIAYEKDLQFRMEQLDALSRACQIVTASLDLDEVLQEIITLAKRLTQADYGGIVLFDEEGRVGQHAEDHIGFTSLQYRLRKNGITHWVLRNQKPAFGDFVPEDGRIDPPLGEGAPQTINPVLISAGIRSFISLPLRAKDQNFGVLHLYSRKPHQFRQSIDLLVAFASQAAIAIDNAYQFHSAQQRLERLISMRQIDKAISSSLDLRLTLDILTSHVLSQLQVDAAAVLLFRPETHSLHFVAGQGFKTPALQHSEIRLGQGFAGTAALERRVVSIFDGEKLARAFERSPNFPDEHFQTYLGVPLIAKGNVIGVLEIYHRQPLKPSAEWMAFLEALAGQAAIAIENTRLFNDLQNANFQLLQAYDATIEGWAKALEFRDMETEGHSRRVVEQTLKLARRLGVEDQQLAAIRRGALLHDIGKMAIPDLLLQKPGPLNEDEWKLMRQHPVFARQMLENIPFLHTALDIPYCHHEKWDGSGYPRGLKGEEIPLAARIFAVVDVWDALISDRPYRKAWRKKQALDYLLEQKGKHFDPKVVDVFLNLLKDEEQI